MDYVLELSESSQMPGSVGQVKYLPLSAHLCFLKLGRHRFVLQAWGNTNTQQLLKVIAGNQAFFSPTPFQNALVLGQNGKIERAGNHGSLGLNSPFNPFASMACVYC